MCQQSTHTHTHYTHTPCKSPNSTAHMSNEHECVHKSIFVSYVKSTHTHTNTYSVHDDYQQGFISIHRRGTQCFSYIRFSFQICITKTTNSYTAYAKYTLHSLIGSLHCNVCYRCTFIDEVIMTRTMSHRHRSTPQAQWHQLTASTFRPQIWRIRSICSFIISLEYACGMYCITERKYA